jgi:hypothetical protein
MYWLKMISLFLSAGAVLVCPNFFVNFIAFFITSKLVADQQSG